MSTRLLLGSTLASLGVPKSQGDANRKLVKVLDDYEIEHRMLLYRDEITRAEIENICPTDVLETSRIKGEERRTSMVSSGVARGGRGGGRGGSRGGCHGSNRNNGRSRNKGSTNAGTSEGNDGSNNPPPTSKNPSNRVRHNRGQVHVDRNPGTCGTSATLKPRLREGRLTGVRRDRTTAVRLCAVLRTLC